VLNLAVFALVGLGAQLVDGALGMAYGVTSTSLLLLTGVHPAAASASVHLAELGTSFVSGVSHWRFGNVDWRLVARLGVPGAVGAFLGATALSSLSTEVAAPWMAGILAALGAYVALRFSTRPVLSTAPPPAGHSRRFLAPLGLTAGFIDASGGGGWGPVATSTLLSAGRVAPRQVIGSVSTSEFLVAAAASAGFLLGLGRSGIETLAVVGLLVGGVVAAPLAAWLVRHLPVAVLGTAVGGLLVLTNARTILAALDAPGLAWTLTYTALAVLWAGFVAAAVDRHRRARAVDAATPV
jgi:uncharacterized protein